MKHAILSLLGGACLCAQQQGSIEGVATNALTHEPLGKVHVRLLAMDFGGVNGVYGAVSDRTGHFSIALIRPGTYILLPELAGFLHVPAKNLAGIPNLTIKPGEHLAYEVEMTPRAVLAGRVVDEAGDPVQNSSVQALPLEPENTPGMLNPAPNPPTDDRGEFRIVVLPGKYYLQAAANSPGGGERPENRSDGTTEAVYGTTYYPSAARKDRGSVVEAVAGKEVGGLEIRLARRQPGLSIRGVITGVPPGASRPYVAMQWGEKSPVANSGRGTQAGPDGTFKFDSLQPGFYRVWAQYSEGKTNYVTRVREWTLENSDVGGVELRLMPGIEVSGKVRMEGEPATTLAGKRSVKLEPQSGFAPGNLQRTGGELDDGGGFRILGVGPTRNRVGVEPLPEGAYVKTVELDGAVSTSDRIDLSDASKSVTVNLVIGRAGVLVSGHVLDASGEPLRSGLAMIFLARDFEEMLGNDKNIVHPASDGSYTLKAFAPGKYKLFAINALQVVGPAAIDSIRRIFDRAEEVEFKEGDRITKDLKVMAKEDAHGKQ